jgi:signal transduction histidine kinase
VRRLILGIVSHILEEDGDILTRWRARLTASILLAALLLSAFPAYNTVNYLVRAGHHWQGAANLFIGAGVAWLLLSRLPSNRVRGWFLSWVCIVVGAVSLATLGPFSAGLVWLYTGVLLATFLLGPRPAAWALGVVLLVLTGVCFGIEWGLLGWAANDEAALLRWRMVAYNVGFLMVVLAGANALIMHLLEEEEQARTAAEHRLAEARRHEAVGTLASGIAHDFNNLLVPILGNLDSVRVELPPGGEGEGALRDVERAALRGRELVQQILTFGRSGMAGRQRVDVGRVAGEVARLLEVALPPGVRIEVTVRGECTVLASGVQMHQILHNLVTNACLAVEEGGGVVRVEVARHPVPGETGCRSGWWTMVWG